MFYFIEIQGNTLKWGGGETEKYRKKGNNKSVTEYLMADVTVSPLKRNNKTFQIQTGSYLKL